MNKPLHILLLEDRPADAELAQRALRQDGLEFRLQHVMTEADFLARLCEPELDVILADYVLPAYDGMSALTAARKQRPDIPFLFVSGQLGEETAINALHQGATDYVLKQGLSRLGPAVRRAIRERDLARQQLQTITALRDSEKRFRAVWNQSADAMRLTDWDGKVVAVNPAYCLLVGKEREALEGLPFTVAYRDVGRHDEMLQNYRERFSSLKVPPREERSMTLWTGDTVDLEISNSYLELGSGQVRLLSLYRDITERKRAEVSLRESEERFRDVSNAAGECLWEVDAQGCFTFLSERVEAMLGYRPDEMLRRSLFEFLNPDERERVNAAWQELARRKHSVREYEISWVSKSGDLLWSSVSAVPVLGRAGEFLGLRGVTQDITARKGAEARIREQASLLDLAQDAIAVWDLSGNVRYWNKSNERVLGWTAEEVVGRRTTDLLKLGSAFLESLRKTLLAKGAWTGEVKVTAKDGRLVTMLCRCTLMRDAQGQPKSVLVINTDITEKENLEAQFLRTQRLESIGQLAGGIAHDLNNILAPMMMIAPILRERVQDEETQNLLHTIESGARRGADVVRQILMFSRGFQSAKIPLQSGHLLRECIRMLQQTFPKNIAIQSQIPGDLWLIEADATQMQQVFTNLAVNARDAMPEGGQLTFKAENRALDETMARQIPHAKAGPYVVCTVSDTGTGIEPNILDRIFDPFFTTKEVGKGTGLGLSTALGIVRNHEGSIQVRSELGRGTEFQIYLPAVPPGASLAENPPGPTVRGHGELILVVDDEPAVRAATRKVLEKSGHRVMVAADGGEAVALMSQYRNEIRLVLTDIMMPKQDGFSLIRALRAIEPQLPIIACSGVADRDHTEELWASGVKHFLEKPFAVPRLLDAIDDVLKR